MHKQTQKQMNLIIFYRVHDKRDFYELAKIYIYIYRSIEEFESQSGRYKTVYHSKRWNTEI